MSYDITLTLELRLQLRERLLQYSTLQDAVDLITSSRRILVLTGAGISEYAQDLRKCSQWHPGEGVSCGIPDFRSRNGLYATLKEKGEYDLDDPQQMLSDFYYIGTVLTLHPSGLT